MKRYFLAFCTLICLTTNCIAGNAKYNYLSVDSVSKDATQLKEFVQLFFVDSICQRKHVIFPLILQYSTDDEPDNRQDTIYIQENNYQTLTLDTRSEVKIFKKDGKTVLVIVTIPDTALEAELSFKKKKDKYFLRKIRRKSILVTN